MIGLVRRDRLLQRAVESADQDEDHHPDAVARRNFRERFPALGRGFLPSALADAAQAALQARPKHSAKLPLVASADREQVAQVVAIAKVVDHPAQAHWSAEHPKGARHAGAMGHQIEVRQAGGKARAQSFPQWQPELPEQWAQQPEAQVAERSVVQVLALVQVEKAEPPQESPPKLQAQLGLVPARQPEARSQRAQLERPASERPPPVAAPQESPRAHSAVAQQEPEQQPDASGPLWQRFPSRLCPPWLALRRRLLHPQRREDVCEPSRQHRPESSSSASSFLVRRTRARGR